MQIKLKTIRNLNIIEKELNNIAAGVLLSDRGEETEQFATSFVYYDKNIYVFIQDSDQFENLKFDSKAGFTAIKENKKINRRKDQEKVIYSIVSISVNGILKKVEENKIKNIVKQSFIQKYSGKLIESGMRSKSFKKLVYIDSQELIAAEETGI